MKNSIVLGLKYVALTILFMIVYIVGNAIFETSVFEAPPPEAQTAIFLGMLLVAAVDTAIIMLLILRSRWSGWKLALAVGFSFYGVTTFLSAIEAAYFGPAFGYPIEALPSMLLGALPIPLIFVPAAVWILGKGRRSATEEEARDERLDMSPIEWLWKLALIALAYLMLYFGFGYFVAWQNPELVAMYDNGANQAVFNPLKLFSLQIVRSMLWVLFALPIIRMTRGKKWQKALAVALLYSLPMGIVLMIPYNPIMPDPSVRMSHFIEIISSNFIFGLVVSYLLLWKAKRRQTTSPAPGSR